MAVWTFLVGQVRNQIPEHNKAEFLIAKFDQIPLLRGLFSSDVAFEKAVAGQWKMHQRENKKSFSIHKNDSFWITFQNDLVIVVGPAEIFQMFSYFSQPENHLQRDHWIDYAEQIFKSLGSEKLIVMTEFEEDELSDLQAIEACYKDHNEFAKTLNDYGVNNQYFFVRKI